MGHMRKMTNKRTWVEISAENLRHNTGELKKLLAPGTVMCPAVKANAYGHGLTEAAKPVLEGGADWLGVDNLAEAMTLRESGITAPVYIMGYTLLDDLETAVAMEFRFMVHSSETLERLAEVTKKLNRPAYTHLKLETGTNRQGVLAEDLGKMASYYKNNPLLVAEGVATHFANIEDTTDHSYAAMQTERFLSMTEILKNHGITPKYRHCANSAATILFKHTHGNFVRPGIAVYGLWPSSETRISYNSRPKADGEKDIDLKPVLSWKTKIASVKKIPADSAIGYGCTYKTTREAVVAILPVGYSDGIRRNQSDKGYVLIGGKRAPVRGRVMMNMTVVEITDIPGVKLEDEAVILGSQNGERISAEQIAALQGTINYEVTTQINPLIERRVV